jgi:hypothetical protein
LPTIWLTVFVALLVVYTVSKACGKPKPHLHKILSVLDRNAWIGTLAIMQSIETDGCYRRKSIVWYHSILNKLEMRGLVEGRLAYPPPERCEARKGKPEMLWRLTEEGTAELSGFNEFCAGFISPAGLAPTGFLSK